MTRILLAGAPTGCWTNLGDEAILAGMVASFRDAVPDARLTVVSSSPPGFHEAYGCDAVPYNDVPGLLAAVERTDLVVLGGGSIFFDYWDCRAEQVLTDRHRGVTLWTTLALLAAATDTPLSIHGVGVGPLHGPAGRTLTEAVFHLADTVSVRDEASRKVLTSLGGARHVAPVVAADPALRVAPAATPSGTAPAPVLGVAVRLWERGVDPDRWQAAVAAAADAWVERTGGSVRFVPCHRGVAWPLTDDVAAGAAVRDRMAHRDRADELEVDLPWGDRAAALADCDVVLGMRYHACLFALAAGVPVVGLSYDPKVTALLRDAGFGGFCFPVEEVDGATLAAHLTRVWDERAELAERARRATARLRDREVRNVEQSLAALADGGGRRTPPGAAVTWLLGRLMDHDGDREPVVEARLRELARRLLVDVHADHGRPASPRPRVALLTNLLLDRKTGQPHVGGAERYALELARLLDDLGLAPTFFQRGGEQWEIGDYFGYPVVGLARGDRFSEFEEGIGAAFHEHTRDFDHVIYLMPNYATGPLRDDAIVVSHGVWWDHDLWPHLSFRTPEWYAHLERVFSRPERVVSVDQNTIDVVRALFPDAASRITHVPNAVDTDTFRPPEGGRESDVPTVLFPRRADEIRGPGVVGPLLDLVPDPVRAVWVGRGSPRLVRELREVATRDPRLSVRDAAFDEMPEWYRRADIVVIPTMGSEGQSLSCLEAMSSGCAVVATRVGGLPELVRDGVDGLLCDPTPESIAEALRPLLRDPGLRRRLGKEARRTALHHSRERWRDRWARVLKEEGWVEGTTAAVPYDIVCFPVVDWEFRWQRPQQMMTHWARRGRRVFYLRVTDVLPDGGPPLVVTPLAENVWEVRLNLPQSFSPHGGRSDNDLVARGMAGLRGLREAHGIDTAVGVAQAAGWTPLARAAVDEFDWRLVYDCMDDWQTFPGFADSPEFLAQERALVEAADLLSVSSRTIQRRWEGIRPDLVVARNAVDFDFYQQPVDEDPLPGITGPVAGFFGAIVSWFDVDLLHHVAQARPDVTFVLVGGVRRVSVKALRQLPNVRFDGYQPYDRLPAYLRRFDVALVPFRVNDATAGMDVVKFYEYISLGTPVVSTPIPEIVPYDGLLYLANGPGEFVDQLDAALAEDDPALRTRRIELARQHTWHERLDRIEDALVDRISGPRRSRARAVEGGDVDRRNQAANRNVRRLERENAELRGAVDRIQGSRAWRLVTTYRRIRAAAGRLPRRL